MKLSSGLFRLRQSTLASASVVLMAMVLGSGFFGLLRLRIMNSIFTPEETGVFFAAFRVPNMIFELLVMGSLSAAFIPVYTKYIAKDRKEEAQTLASGVIIIVTLFLTFLILPCFVFAREFSRFFAPGYTPAELDMMATFTRIMLVFQVIPLVIGNFLTGILQSHRLYIVPAAAPVLYNIGMIIGIVAFSRNFGIIAAPVGVAIGAFLFLLVQIPSVYILGLRLRVKGVVRHSGVFEVIRLTVPRVFGLGVSQVDATVDLMLATILGPKMVTVFYLAQSLQQLPVRLFGSTVSQASLPILSSATAGENRPLFKASLMSAYSLILFFIIPSTVFLFVLRIPVVRLIYGASKFDWEATVLTAMTLSMFSFSLAFQSISQVFTRGFFALYDTKTPVYIGIISITVNALLSVYFVKQLALPVYALGISASLASMVNACFSVFYLYRRVGGFPLQELVGKPLKIGAVSIITGVVMYVPYKLFDELVFDTTRVSGLLSLTVSIALLGIVTYAFLAWIFDVGEVATLVSFWKKIRKIRSFIMSGQTEVVRTDEISDVVEP